MAATHTRTGARRRQPAMMILLALCVLLGGCSRWSEEPGDAAAAAAGDEHHMSFSYFPALHSMAVLVAQSAGLYEEEGVTVDLTAGQSGGVQFTMVTAGEVDASGIELQNVARSRGQARELLHVFPLVDKMSMNFVVHNDVLAEHGVSPDDPVEERLALLSQLRIGYTTPNSPTDSFARFLIRQAGNEPDDSRLISVGSAANLVAALKTRQIDGFMLTPPTPNVPELEGYGTILLKPSVGDIAALDDFPYIGVAVRKDWVEDNAETLRRFARALLRANEMIRADPESMAPLLAEWFPDMDQQALLAGLRDMAPSMHPTGLLTTESVQRYLTVSQELGMLDLEELPPADEGELWTNRFVE